MTPLAHRTLKQLTWPADKRTFSAHILNALRDAQYFEVSEVVELARQLAEGDGKFKTVEAHGHQVTTMSERTLQQFCGMAERLAFLPAPLTWIEFRDNLDNEPVRIGFLCVDGRYREGWITVTVLCNEDKPYEFSFPKSARAIEEAVSHGEGVETFDEWTAKAVFLTKIIAYLAFINTPKVIGRRQHMPHVGLQRALARAHKMVGKYPLHAWTEIVLDVSKPEFADDTVHEARLTGMKALHFCRAHLRIRNGMVEFVRAHWRGDPAIGIKRSRYRLTA